MPALLCWFFHNDWLVCLGLFLGFVSNDPLDESLADFCDSVVVVCAIGIVVFEESELGLMLLALDQDLLEFRAVLCDVLSGLLQKL